MTKLRELLTALMITMLLLGCSEEPHNIYDPQGEYYVPPQIEIISGPNDGDPTNSNPVDFELKVDERIEYRYKFDEAGWSDWTNLAQKNCFSLMDPSEGKHTVEIEYNYAERFEEYSESRVITFEADPLYPDETALMIKWPLTKVDEGGNFKVELVAVKVDDLMLIHAVLTYAPSMIQVVEIVERREIFEQNEGKMIFFAEQPGVGRIEIIAGVGGSSPPGVGGDDPIPIAQFIFTALKRGETELTIDGTSELRDSGNHSIPLKKLLNGEIQIQ